MTPNVWASDVWVTQVVLPLEWFLTIDGRDYDVEWELGAPRCGHKELSSHCFCPLWPYHDGPHIRMSYQFDEECGGLGLAFTGMRSRAT